MMSVRAMIASNSAFMPIGLSFRRQTQSYDLEHPEKGHHPPSIIIIELRHTLHVTEPLAHDIFVQESPSGSEAKSNRVRSRMQIGWKSIGRARYGHVAQSGRTCSNRINCVNETNTNDTSMINRSEKSVGSATAR